MAKKKWLYKILAILPSISLIVILLISSFEIGAYGDWNFMKKNSAVKVKTSVAQKKENRSGWMFITPYLIFFTVFTAVNCLIR